MERMISVVIGSLNRRKYLELTLQTLRKELLSIPGDHEIFVVDGGSDDGTVEWLVTQKDIISIIQHNRGEWNGSKLPKRSWGYFMNLGFKAATGKYTVMLSDDCLVVPGAIKNSIEQFETARTKNNKIGAIAYFWRNWPDMNNYWVGRTLGGKIFVNHGIYLNSALKEVDYIDEDRFKFYCADGDLCLKLWQKGYSVEAAQNSYIEHFMESTPTLRKENNAAHKNDWLAFTEKWNGVYGSKDQDAETWIYQEFSDVDETCRLFMGPSKANFTRALAKSKLRTIRDFFKKSLA